MGILIQSPVVLAIIGYAALKGLVISMVVLALASSFTNALIIALASGTLGVIGMVLAAWISARAFHQSIHPELYEVKQKLDEAANNG